jgi:predicted cupin superfamily sugar epimerase
LVILAGTWFGGYLNEGGSFGLMGTTVAPGFEFQDFVLGEREPLLRDFPQAEKEINRLT